MRITALNSALERRRKKDEEGDAGIILILLHLSLSKVKVFQCCLEKTMYKSYATCFLQVGFLGLP